MAVPKSTELGLGIARGEAIMLKFWMIMLYRTARKISLLCSRNGQLYPANVQLCSNFH